MEEHTWHWQPITGTPCDVPVPRNVISTSRIAIPSWHSPTMTATLASLRIRNLALVEEMTWETGPGFVAVTGETGAGKSIILGALTMVLGERTDRGIIRSGAENCAVEAAFENVDDSRAAACWTLTASSLAKTVASLSNGCRD
jgi:hypothetical protein